MYATKADKNNLFRSEACKALKYEIGSSIAELPRILFLHGERERRLVIHLDR